METTELDIDLLNVLFVVESLRLAKSKHSQFVQSTTLRFHRIFSSPGGTLDFFFAACLAAVGLYFLQHTTGSLSGITVYWARIRYPAMLMEMERIMAVPVWSTLLMGVGAVTALALMLRSMAVVATCHIVAVIVWTTLGWIWGIRPVVPPMLGVLAPLFAFFTFVRVLQLPVQEDFPSGRGPE